MSQPKQNPSSKWDQFLAQLPAQEATEHPLITTVIPTFNASHAITTTIKSVLRQDYPHFEILVIDGGSRDRTIEIVKGYAKDGVRLYRMGHYRVYELLNRGISVAEGKYVNVLFPGDTYLSNDVFKLVAAAAEQKKSPDLIYGGTLLRNWRAEPNMLLRPLSLENLRLGKQPTGLQACWWRVDTVTALGKFPTHLHMRGGYDLMCRLQNTGGLRSNMINRVLTDSTSPSLTYRKILRHFLESFKLIWHHYGNRATLAWWIEQKDFRRSCRLWFRSMRVAFLGKK